MNREYVEIQLGSVCKLKNGYAFKSSNYQDEGVPVIRISDIRDGIVSGLNAKKVDGQDDLKDYIIENNSILVAMSGATTGKFGIYRSKEKAYQNQRVGKFEIINENLLNNEFLYYQLHALKRQIEKDAYGGAQPNISSKKIELMNVVLFPLPIQRAIVAKIEQLFSELDNGIQNLQQAKDKLAIFRQAVLKKAFEGELTKEWRKKQNNLPSAGELLVQINEERENHYKQQLEEWEKAVKTWEENGKVGKKPGKPRPLTIPESPNSLHNERKWKIPENWIWSQIGSLCFVTKLAGFEYTDYVTYDETGDLPVIKAENAGSKGFKKTNFSKVKSDSVSMLERSQIFGGELLIVFVGAGTGNVAMVPFNQRYFLGPNIGMARPYFDLNSKYLELFFQSIIGKSLMMSAVKAVAQPSLSMGTIRQSPVAFPHLEEQNQIVQEIESRLSVCDEMEKSIESSLTKAEALRQSILKKAFEGELLTEKEIDQCKQEPDWETVEELLERIEKENNKTKE